MTHEVSISVEIDGRHFNLPTVIRGKQISDDEAVDGFLQGTIRPLGSQTGYETQSEAIGEAGNA